MIFTVEALENCRVIAAQIIPASEAMQEKRSELDGDCDGQPDLPMREDSFGDRELAGPSHVRRKPPTGKRARHNG